MDTFKRILAAASTINQDGTIEYFNTTDRVNIQKILEDLTTTIVDSHAIAMVEKHEETEEFFIGKSIFHIEDAVKVPKGVELYKNYKELKKGEKALLSYFLHSNTEEYDHNSPNGSVETKAIVDTSLSSIKLYPHSIEKLSPANEKSVARRNKDIDVATYNKMNKLASDIYEFGMYSDKLTVFTYDMDYEAVLSEIRAIDGMKSFGEDRLKVAINIMAEKKGATAKFDESEEITLEDGTVKITNRGHLINFGSQLLIKLFGRHYRKVITILEDFGIIEKRSKHIARFKSAGYKVNITIENSYTTLDENIIEFVKDLTVLIYKLTVSERKDIRTAFITAGGDRKLATIFETMQEARNFVNNDKNVGELDNHAELGGTHKDSGIATWVIYGHYFYAMMETIIDGYYVDFNDYADKYVEIVENKVEQQIAA